jgi:hypothetical protein
MRDELKVGFIVTVTMFLGPRDVILDELRIENCFPIDSARRLACERLASQGR